MPAGSSPAVEGNEDRVRLLRLPTGDALVPNLTMPSGHGPRVTLYQKPGPPDQLLWQLVATNACNRHYGSGDVTSQTFTVLSPLPVASRRPSGENARPMTIMS